MLDSGDCSVIKSPMGKNIIIDGGNNQDYDYGENVVVPYLLDRKITKIDFLMVSHRISEISKSQKCKSNFCASRRCHQN